MPRGAIPAALKKRRGKGGKARKPKAKPEPAYDSDASNVDDDDFEGWDGYKPGGYHPVKVGEVYNERYKVLQKLGWGHFSTVWRCADMADAGRIVALKVQKSASHYTEAAADEIAILDFVGDQADGMGQDIPVVRLLDTFTHSGPHGRHTCMVFELLGDNLLRLIKASRYRGVSPQTVRALTRRITRALAFLHSHCGIIHTDVKPENVLLTHSVEDLPGLDQFAPRRSAAADASAARSSAPKAAADSASAEAAAANDEAGDEDMPEDAEYDPTTARGGAGWASTRRHHSASRSPPRSRRQPDGAGATVADSDDDNEDDDAASGRSDEPPKVKVPGVDFPATTDDEPAWIAKELAGTSMSKRLVKATRRRLKQCWARMRLAAAAAPAAPPAAAEGPPPQDDPDSPVPSAGASPRAAQTSAAVAMQATGRPGTASGAIATAAPAEPEAAEAVGAGRAPWATITLRVPAASATAAMVRAGLTSEWRVWAGLPAVRSRAGWSAVNGRRRRAATAADGSPGDDFDQSDLDDIGAAAQAALEGDEQDDDDDDDDDDSVDIALDPVAFQSAAADLLASAAAEATGGWGLLVRLRRLQHAETSNIRRLCSDLHGRTVEASVWPLASEPGLPSADGKPSLVADSATADAVAQSLERAASTLSAVSGGRAIAAGAAVESLEALFPGLRVCVAADFPSGADDEDDEAGSEAEDEDESEGGSAATDGQAGAAAGSNSSSRTGLMASRHGPDSFELRLLSALGIDSHFKGAEPSLPASQALWRVRALGAAHGCAGSPASVAKARQDAAEAAKLASAPATTKAAGSAASTSTSRAKAAAQAGVTALSPAAAAKAAAVAARKRIEAAAPPQRSRPQLSLWGRMLMHPVPPAGSRAQAVAEARAAAHKGVQPHSAMPLTPAEAVLLETGELDAVGCIAVRGFAAVLPTTRAEADRGSALAAVRLGRGATFPDAAWVRDAIAVEAERRAGEPAAGAAASAASEAGAGGCGVQWRSALERVLLACSDVRWRNDGGRGSDDTTARRRLAAARHAWEFRVRQMGAVVVDLGNACWVDKHFTDDVQTRQYRSPEVTLAAGYDTSADVWSLGCMVFEMLTGELLFDPRKGDMDKRSRQPLWSREADHIAQIIELLGPAPRSAALAGKASGDFFTADGALRSIPSLRFWGPAAVLHCKYRLPLAEARLAESFLVETLAFDPQQRTPAQEILQHPFIACSLSAPQLAAKSPEDWGWLTQRLLPNGKPSPAALAELEPVEHPSAFATRADVVMPADLLAAESEDGASSSGRGDLTGDPDADALADLVAEFGSLEAAREAVVSMHGDEAGAALDAAAAGDAALRLRPATEASDAQLGLVQPLGEAAVARLLAGERAEDITTEALWATAHASLSPAESVAAKSFTRLALRSLTGDPDAARRIKAALEAGGPVGAVATEGVAIAREYVTLCLSRAADAEFDGDAREDEGAGDGDGDGDGDDNRSTSDGEDASGSDAAPGEASGDDESI